MRMHLRYVSLHFQREDRVWKLCLFVSPFCEKDSWQTIKYGILVFQGGSDANRADSLFCLKLQYLDISNVILDEKERNLEILENQRFQNTQE